MAFAKTTRASLLSLALSLLSSTTIAAPNLAFESDWGIRAAVARNEINVTASEASGHVSESRWPSGLSFGVDYYPSQWAESMWDSDAQRMANGSISYVRIGEFDW